MRVTVKRLKQLIRESTAFASYDVVVSRVDAQGLKKGARYVVVGAKTKHTPFGGFVTYTVEPESGGPRLDVSNGHLVLDLVERGARPRETKDGR